ncbi:MAG: Wzz/FepE/Etk N-terminal domain-containing protein, partial [Candidatus Acidoferrales bacterium]
MEREDKLVRAPGQPLQAPGRPPGSPGSYIGLPNSEEAHVRDYLRVLHKYRLTILLFVFFSVLTVAVVSLRLPKQYEAVVRLAIDKQSASELQAEYTVALDPWSYQEYLQTQIRLLESETLAEKTIRMLRLDQEPDFAGSRADAEGAGPLPAEA